MIKSVLFSFLMLMTSSFLCAADASLTANGKIRRISVVYYFDIEDRAQFDKYEQTISAPPWAALAVESKSIFYKFEVTIGHKRAEVENKYKKHVAGIDAQISMVEALLSSQSSGISFADTKELNLESKGLDNTNWKGDGMRAKYVFILESNHKPPFCDLTETDFDELRKIFGKKWSEQYKLARVDLKKLEQDYLGWNRRYHDVTKILDLSTTFTFNNPEHLKMVRDFAEIFKQTGDFINKYNKLFIKLDAKKKKTTKYLKAMPGIHIALLLKDHAHRRD